MKPLIGIMWRNGYVQAWRIEPNGAISDRLEIPDLGGGENPATVAHCIARVQRRWPDVREFWAAGAPGLDCDGIERFCDAPITVAELAARSSDTLVQDVRVHVVPGLTCTAPHGGPDMMRSEAIALCGYLALVRDVPYRDGCDDFVLLPGAHGKWVQCRGDRIIGFFTSLGGEIFNQLTARGALSAVSEGKGRAGPVFDAACQHALRSGLGIGALLFEARVRVERSGLTPSNAASHLRGLLIGSEIGDATHNYPFLSKGRIVLIGEETLCALFARALGHRRISTAAMSQEACAVAGFHALASARSQRAMRAA